jgi:hypothetical protein
LNTPARPTYVLVRRSVACVQGKSCRGATDCGLSPALAAAAAALSAAAVAPRAVCCFASRVIITPRNCQTCLLALRAACALIFTSAVLLVLQGVCTCQPGHHPVCCVRPDALQLVAAGREALAGAGGLLRDCRSTHGKARTGRQGALPDWRAVRVVCCCRT